MVSPLSQKDYLTYFDAIHAFTTVTLHGIENVSLKDQTFIPINRFNWIHSHILGIGRVIGAVFSKRKRLNRQKETDQKISRLTDSIRVINETNQRIVPQVKKSDTAGSLIAHNYYTLKASKLHQEALQQFTNWNKKIENITKKRKSLKNRLNRFIGFAITSSNPLTVANTPQGTLIEIPNVNFFKFSSQPFISICRGYRGFSNRKRGLGLINHSRLQIMGGMSQEAVKKGEEILKKEKKLDVTEKMAFESASMTSTDSMALEEYMETLALNTFKSGHGQLELSEEILHFETQIGGALIESFKKVESFDLLFPLFRSAKHHFCHNQTSKMQAIHVLMNGIFKPYVANHFTQLTEADLEKWLNESIALFPEEIPWMKALFFEEVIRAFLANAPAKKESLRAFSSKHLVCTQLSLEYITRKLN